MRSPELAYKSSLPEPPAAGLKKLVPDQRPLAGFEVIIIGRF